MSRSTLIALGAGLASALFWLTGLLGPIASLPLFLAGLSLGTQAASIACAVGFFLIWLLGTQIGDGALLAGLYGLVYAVPALIVMRQSLLRRQPPTGPTIWYGSGGIVSILTAFFLGLLLLAASFFWLNGLSVGDALATQVAELVKAVDAEWTEAERQNVIARTIVMLPDLVSVLPGLVMTSWLLMTLASAGIAQSLLTRMGRNLRPKGSLHEVNLPLWMSWLLVISAAVALVGPGDLGYIGDNLALVAAAPFFMVGLSLAHMMAKRLPSPGLALTAFYLVLLLLGPALLLVAGIGIIDQWYGLRHRLGAPGNDQETE